MKTTILVLALIAITTSVRAQALEEFYDKTFGFYTPISNISAKSASMDTLGMESGMTFWGIAGMGASFANTRPMGFTFHLDTRQIGDLFYILRGLLSKDGKNRDFRNQYYLSDLGFLPNMRFGLNVFARDNMVVNIGLYNSYYISYVGLVHAGSVSFENVHLLSAGPNIYVDRALNDWLAARISTGPMFAYGVMPKQIKEGDNVPRLWESKIELFTKWGAFTSLELLNLHGYHDEMEKNMKIKRFDFKIGVRFRF